MYNLDQPVNGNRSHLRRVPCDCPTRLRRPYTFVVAALLLLLLTPFILLRTPTIFFHRSTIPVVSIVWNYTGLNAVEMEKPYCLQ